MSVQDNVTDALKGVANEPPEVKAAVGATVAAVTATQLGGKSLSVLWYILIGGLVVVLFAALGGIIYILIDDSGAVPDVLVTIFSATLAALVGLFAKAP